jgi:hypothetical protein
MLRHRERCKWCGPWRRAAGSARAASARRIGGRGLAGGEFLGRGRTTPFSSVRHRPEGAGAYGRRDRAVHQAARLPPRGRRRTRRPVRDGSAGSTTTKRSLSAAPSGSASCAREVEQAGGWRRRRAPAAAAQPRSGTPRAPRARASAPLTYPAPSPGPHDARTLATMLTLPPRDRLPALDPLDAPNGPRARAV